jgi:hypothetical protein
LIAEENVDLAGMTIVSVPMNPQIPAISRLSLLEIHIYGGISPMLAGSAP